jgi:hypothetical protein
VATTRPACSFRAPRGSCSFRLKAEVLVLLLLFAGCGPTVLGKHDDPSISTRVKIALLNDPQVGLLRIDAKTEAGVVTLSGTARTPADVDRALAVARRVTGVRDAKSELKVGGS